MLREMVIDLKQKRLLCDLKGERSNVAPYAQEAPLMRLTVARLRRVVEGDLRIEFVQQDLTSYGGVDLLRRYLRRTGLTERLRAACASLGGDHGGAAGTVDSEPLLRRASTSGAVAVPRRGSADGALLRLGAPSHHAHRGQWGRGLARYPGGARLQPPPRQTGRTAFPYAAFLPASRQGLCDLSD